jgi:hypothetical protein
VRPPEWVSAVILRSEGEKEERDFNMYRKIRLSHFLTAVHGNFVLQILDK